MRFYILVAMLLFHGTISYALTAVQLQRSSGAIEQQQPKPADSEIQPAATPEQEMTEAPPPKEQALDAEPLPETLPSQALPRPNGPSSKPNPYQLFVIPLNEGGVAIARCNTYTGEGQYTLGEKWVRGVDSGNLPQSLYLCRVAPFPKKGWRFVRMDVMTGDSWILQGAHWKKILPP